MNAKKKQTLKVPSLDFIDDTRKMSTGMRAHVSNAADRPKIAATLAPS